MAHKLDDILVEAESHPIKNLELSSQFKRVGALFSVNYGINLRVVLIFGLTQLATCSFSCFHEGGNI